MTTPFKFSLRQGHTIVGKWKHGRYVIDRLLGEGANGRVYLVTNNWQKYALKLGTSTVDLQSEINALQALASANKVESSYLKDIDDWITPDGKEIPFYTMRYVEGMHLTQFITQSGDQWLSLIGLNLLKKLSRLHSVKWVFGDLKPENIIVENYGQVELIDFGGATPFGKGVKQFTELYDRGYWNSGSRSAEASYDLFSFAVLCIQICSPKKLATLCKTTPPQQRSTEQLLLLAREITVLQPYIRWLEKAFLGKFKDATEALQYWKPIIHEQHRMRKNKKTPRWLKVMVVLSMLSLSISASLYVLDNIGLLK